MSRIRDVKVQQSAVSAFNPAFGRNDDEDESASAAVAGRERDSDTISIRSRHTLAAFGASSPGDEEEEDPWSAIPRPISAASPEGIVQLTRAQRKQLLLRALLQLIALFIVCLVGLGGTLYLALPVIDEADKANLKLPRNFNDLKNLNTTLQHYKSEHFQRVLLCWVIIYMFLQAFSIPGSMYMSILAGALFGVPLALPLVCASVATGASICYLISKFLGVVLVALPNWQKRVQDWKDKLAEHNDGMLSYLIVIRMMPLPPHNIVNILSPHLGIPLPLFWPSTFLGIFAVSVIHTTIGEKLDQMTSPDDFHLFSLRNMLLLVGVAGAVLIPVAVKKFAAQPTLDEDEAGPGRGPVYLDDTEGGESFQRNPLIGAATDDNDDDDELPHRNLDTANIMYTPTYLAGAAADAEESFPSWHDAPIHTDDQDQDQDPDPAAVFEEAGRGGVFNDRLPPQTQNRPQRKAGITGWIADNTRIRL